jgi:hypothetical protein
MVVVELGFCVTFQNWISVVSVVTWFLWLPGCYDYEAAWCEGNVKTRIPVVTI